MDSILGLVVVLAILAAVIAIPVLLIKGIICFIISLFSDTPEAPKSPADEQFVVFSGNEQYGVASVSELEAEGITDSGDIAGSDKFADTAEAWETAESAIIPEKAEKAPISQKPCKKLSASEIMLLIGTAFIVLAALTFVAANWVKMEPAGRVFALIFAGGLSFGISAVMEKAVKLERTSAAFYGIGSVITAISYLTAGYYELFGTWFSIDGDGRWLFNALFLGIISASAFISYPIYKRSVSFIFGFASAYAAILPLCRQIGETKAYFSLALIFAQFILTALVHVLRPHKGMAFEKQLNAVSKVFSVLFALISFNYVLFATGDGAVIAYIISALILVQLIFYGITANRRWMFIFADLLGIYMDFMICSDLPDSTTESEAVLIFGLIAAAIYAVNRFVKGTTPACRAISLAGLVLGAVIAMTDDPYESITSIIIPAIAALAVAEYILHPSELIQKIAAFAAPVLPFFMTVLLHNYLDREYSGNGSSYTGCIHGTVVFSVLALLYMGAAAFFLYLPKISFALHAKHPGKTDFILYTNMAAAGAILISLGADFTSAFAAIIALSILHFILSSKLPVNLTGVLSAAALAAVTSTTIRNYISPEALSSENIAADYLIFAVFAAFVAAARFMYPNKLADKQDGRAVYDVLTIASPVFLFAYSYISDTARFLRFITIAVIIASLVKRGTDKKTAAILLSVSAVFAAIGLLTRPFLIPEDSFITTKINMAIIALLGIAYRFIWREFPATAKTASTFIFVGDFIWLIIDGLVDDRAGNKIFVLTVTAAILILSFFLKSKTWFTSSSVSLVLITLISTWQYIDKAGWWLYLLIVGVVLVAIAGVNEACRKKGESVKATVAKTFSDWTW